MAGRRFRCDGCDGRGGFVGQSLAPARVSRRRRLRGLRPGGVWPGAVQLRGGRVDAETMRRSLLPILPILPPPRLCNALRNAPGAVAAGAPGAGPLRAGVVVVAAVAAVTKAEHRGHLRGGRRGKFGRDQHLRRHFAVVHVRRGEDLRVLAALLPRVGYVPIGSVGEYERREELALAVAHNLDGVGHNLDGVRPAHDRHVLQRDHLVLLVAEHVAVEAHVVAEEVHPPLEQNFLVQRAQVLLDEHLVVRQLEQLTQRVLAVALRLGLRRARVPRGFRSAGDIHSVVWGRSIDDARACARGPVDLHRLVRRRNVRRRRAFLRPRPRVTHGDRLVRPRAERHGHGVQLRARDDDVGSEAGGHVLILRNGDGAGQVEGVASPGPVRGALAAVRVPRGPRLVRVRRCGSLERVRPPGGGSRGRREGHLSGEARPGPAPGGGFRRRVVVRRAASPAAARPRAAVAHGRVSSGCDPRAPSARKFPPAVAPERFAPVASKTVPPSGVPRGIAEGPLRPSGP